MLRNFVFQENFEEPEDVPFEETNFEEKEKEKESEQMEEDFLDKPQEQVVGFENEDLLRCCTDNFDELEKELEEQEKLMESEVSW